MAFAKWIGGILGFLISGPLGALAGYALGAFLEGPDVTDFQDERNRDNRYSQDNGRYERDSGIDIGKRNSFLFSLLVLTSYIIKADGKVMHSEMEHVRRFLTINFGENARVQGEDILNKLFEQQKKMEAERKGSYRDIVMQSCAQIASNLSYGQRLQLLSFLAEVIKADGIIAPIEVDAIREIARAMQMSDNEVDSLLNLQDSSKSLEAAYKVFGLSPNASDDEVRKAYRALALKHHPDRVATLGEDVRKAAEKKFQEINAAKDLIYKSRGL